MANVLAITVQSISWINIILKTIITQLDFNVVFKDLHHIFIRKIVIDHWVLK